MPSISTITVNDADAVAHIYTPVSIDSTLAHLSEKVGVPITDPWMKLSTRGPVNGNGIYKVRLSLANPYGNVVDGVTTVDHTCTTHVEFLFSERSTEAQRLDIRARLYNALLNTTVRAAVVDLEGTWG